MENGPQKTARQTFGEVLRFHREQRSLTVRRVADMTGNGSRAVENFEAGHVVPDGKTWDKYKGIVNKRLGAYSELRQRALAEADADRALIIKGMEQRKMATATPPNGTNGHNHNNARPPAPPLAHKPFSGLAGITAPPPDAVTHHTAPIPRMIDPDATHAPSGRKRGETAGEQLGQEPRGLAVDGRRLMPDRPVGSMTRAAVDQRIAWARLQFRSRPKMPIHGADGLLAMMRQRFGVGLDPDTCTRIKLEIQTELGQLPPSVPPGIVSARPEPTIAAPPVADARPRAPEPTAAVKDSDLATAVELVLGAVPGLARFSIVVDDNGEASVDYTVREVKITERGGSLKVKR